MGWIGVDLDGTLAYWPGNGKGWITNAIIGEPIAPMVERVKKWLAEGQEVKIFTARVSGDEYLVAKNYMAIVAWCNEHIGQELEVTCVKDYQMIQLWDDRAVAVEHNTGKILGGYSAL